ncbi:hypothetical protein SEA_NEFERTHENA_25 [Microbacterium phage Neferthena]|uniref:Minor tail protein n=1 Tax=Microbacterium phage Neferthena TaxID=2301539 RepID=A0A385D4B3_9CAUD|nr:hypothetical protein HOT92_gp25 [Microbacterium phage Neferthena]AXQ52889.1 hypothetical protein SEA_NEFERTHENA_25 [Microbacterium phage Neferthena]
MTEQELLKIAIKEKRRQAWYFITIIIVLAVSLGLGWLNSALGREAWRQQADTWQAQYLDLYDEFIQEVGQEPSAPAPDDIADQGPQGEQGQQGDPGAVGPQGPSGLPGVPGLNGLDGLPGATGPTGAPGPAGADGVAGATGATGEPGPAGAQGPAGPAGPQGPQGVAGPTCPEGVTPAVGFIYVYDQTGVFATLTRVTYCPAP